MLIFIGWEHRGRIKPLLLPYFLKKVFTFYHILIIIIY